MDGASADALLDRVRAGSVLWLMHVNADPDCVGSAFALREAFGGTVGAPDGMSRAGTRLAKRLGLEPDIWPHPDHFATVVAVDTSQRSQLGRLGPAVPNPCVVDHHRYGDLQEGAPALAWEARASCCEVVLALLDRAGKAPSPEAAFGLLAGLAEDTAWFRFADPPAMEAAARLMRLSGATLEALEEFLRAEDDAHADDPSLRRATLQATQRAEVELIAKQHLLVTSRIGSFDAAAASVLVRAGADVAVVVNEHATRARLSMRASRRARDRGVDLGLVASEAAREVGWTGGGHEGAAGLSGAPPAAPAREAVLRLLRAKLGGA